MALTAVLDAGHLDCGDFDRQRLTAGDVIRRSTYMLAGTAVAVRVTGDPDGNDGLHYLYSDHLGSASAIQNSDGRDLIITRYTPFGSYRAGSGTNEVTDRGFTGHKHNDDLGLVYMNARFYVSGISRFASADSIVPDPARPQSHNRYSYVENRPLMLIDPSGHIACDSSFLDAQDQAACANPDYTYPHLDEKTVWINVVMLQWQNDPYFLNLGLVMTDAAVWVMATLYQGADAAVAAFGGEPHFQADARQRAEQFEACSADPECLLLMDPFPPMPTSPSGAARAAQHSEYWQEASLSNAVTRIAGDNPIIDTTLSGKTIYENPINGMQVVYDNAGNYFRIYDPSATGRAAYTDLYGNPLPGNVPVVQSTKTTMMGLPRAIWQSLTHFLNID